MPSKMQYVRLGNSGLKISKIILGCMSYGSKDWQGWVLPEEEAIKHIKFAYEHGITTFDTADMYSNGLSEIILGKAIKQLDLPRDEIVIMTKLWSPIYKDQKIKQMGPSEEFGVINQKGLSRKHIFDGVKAALERLQTDHIDLLQCHRFDRSTPIEETMQALHDVVKAGWVRYIGMSSCYAYEYSNILESPVHAMQNYAITNKLTPFISMQNHYSLLYREEEREMMPTLKMFGVGAIPWSPLARGLLTHPFDEKTARTTEDSFMALYNRVSFGAEIVGRVEELAKRKGISMAQVGMAWILSRPGVSAPIVGTTKLSNLEDILGSLDVELTEEETKYLEEPYRPLPVLGH
ncbi:Aldo/keto reductase [Epithele typhae]|uniref:Aldo/keto reductase n=1 Tax=Epithele typhae TaxID=378194 RepID=UPI0020076800|nr:Aldo/keto reductase [Epithele typhae]KAH9938838.1 Aldo/keto reductase [Epithele typhae]